MEFQAGFAWRFASLGLKKLWIFLHTEAGQSDDKSAVVTFSPSHQEALWLARGLLVFFEFIGKVGPDSLPTRPLSRRAAVGPSKGS